jgi:hypothetical protein
MMNRSTTTVPRRETNSIWNCLLIKGKPVTGTSAPTTPGGPPDIEQLVAITQKYGVELLPPAEHAG